MVKFGHSFAEGIKSLGLDLQCDALNYKEFKKLLKFAVSEDAHPSSSSLDAATHELTSCFWTWPKDSEGIETKTRIEWVDRVFERKLLAEANRVQGFMLAAGASINAKHELLSNLQAKMQADNLAGSSEDDVRRRMELQSQINDQEHQLRAYSLLNYTGFFKILKKYDKVHCGHGIPSKMVRVMPLVDKLLSPGSLAAEEGVQGSMQKLDSAFEEIKNLLSDHPEKESHLDNLHMSQVALCKELLDTVRSSSSISDDPSMSGVTLWGKGCHFIASGKLMPPFVDAIRSSNYNLHCFMEDLMSAIIISIAGIPKAMAYAALAGLPIDSGIATLYMPCLVYAVIGSSRQVAISPQSVTCLLLAQIVDEALRGSGLEDDMAERVELSMLYTLITGFTILVFGLLRLGFLLNFISRPVLSGFVSASALIAVASTFKSLMGLHVKKSPILYVLVMRVVEKLPDVHWPTGMISFGGICLIITLNLLSKYGAPKLKKMEGKSASVCLRVVKVPSVIYLVLGGIILGGFLCSFTPLHQWTLKHTVIGRGATFPASLYERVADEMNCRWFSNEVQVEYSATGSGDGLRSVLSNESILVDFAGSDVKPSPSDLQMYGVEVFSSVRSMLCPAVNLPFLLGSDQIRLVLDLPTVADIFAGRITKWRDERIRKHNPNLPWHLAEDHHTISAVLRTDESGTTQAFSEALLHCDGCNATAFVAGLTVAWGAPKQVLVQGMAGMVNGVESTPWSIGYASFSAVRDAKSQTMCSALLTAEGVSTALVAWMHPKLVQWPLWHTSYLLVPPVKRVADMHGKPRLDDKCEARRLLHEYFNALYSNPEMARQYHFELSLQSLGSVKCPHSDRRLAYDKGVVLGACKKPTPKCSDIKMVGYMKPTFLKIALPSPKTQIPFGALLTNSLLLSCIALLEHVANVKLYADRGRYQVSTSLDLAAVGISNILGCMSGSFVVAGGFSRSALNAKARTQISMLLSVFVSVGVLYVGAPLLSMLPDAILSVVLFMAVIGLVDWKMALQLFRLRREGFVDLLALIIAFTATCFLGVVQGMASAIGFSLVVFVFNSSYPQIIQLDRQPGTMYYTPAEPQSKYARPPNAASAASASRIKVLRFEAPLWFANASRFLDRMLLELKAESRINALILDMSTVPWVDFSAGVAIKEVIRRADDNNVEICFAHTNAQVKNMIISLSHVDEASFFASNFDAGMSLGSGRRLPRLTSSLGGSSVKFGKIQTRRVWPLGEDNTHESSHDTKDNAVKVEVINPDSDSEEGQDGPLRSSDDEAPTLPASTIGRPRQRTLSGKHMKAQGGDLPI